ncbi:MAG TPA: efflux RND transporter periplasmic adaptor subunit [Aestuariivirgaceae bacterium]|jgi:RND family efflux transporter MFP subunit
MWFFALPLTIVLALAGCKPEHAPVQSRPVRTLVVDLKPVNDDRYAIGEIKPRYESDLSFRVAGKILSRPADVGGSVKKGDVLATLDTQDYQNRLRSAEADVSSAEAALVEAQTAEARHARLLKDGATPRADYDAALRDLRAAQARLIVAKANLSLAQDQLNYTELKADFDGVITAVGAEPGQNVNAGQMVVKLAQLSDKDGVFNIAEAALTEVSNRKLEVVVWPLSNPNLTIEGMVREISPVADPVTRTYGVKVTLRNPPPQIPFGVSIGGRLKSHAALGIVLPISAIFEKNGSPAVWVFDQHSGSVTLRPIAIARYEANTAVVASGLAKGDIVVTAGVNTLRMGQKVRLAETASLESNTQ